MDRFFKLSERGTNAKTEFIAGMYSRVYVEITNICNMNCSFCHGHSREPRKMTEEEYARILQQLTGKTQYIYNHLMGEPLFHPHLERYLQLATNAGFRVIRTSAETGEGAAELMQLLRGKLTAFTGNSGVGKSSMLNALCPQLNLATGEVSEKLGRGRHTTRHVELYRLGEDTYVADTPGFSSFDTDQMDVILKENLQYAFPDFGDYIGRCQFHDCSHRKEPGCAVTAAVGEGRIERTRYDSYLRLYEKAALIKEWELK